MMRTFLAGRRSLQLFLKSQLDPAVVRSDGASEVFALISVADVFFLF